MPVLNKNRSELIVIDEEAESITDFTPSGKMLPEEMERLLRRLSSLSVFRRQHIITVRQQIAEGKYDCDEKINKILDKLLTSVS